MASIFDSSEDYIDIAESDDVQITLLKKMFCTCEISHFLFSFSLIQPSPIANKKVLLIKKNKRKNIGVTKYFILCFDGLYGHKR